MSISIAIWHTVSVRRRLHAQRSELCVPCNRNRRARIELRSFILEIRCSSDESISDYICLHLTYRDFRMNTDQPTDVIWCDTIFSTKKLESTGKNQNSAH